MAPKRFGYGFRGMLRGPLALTLLMLRIGADDHHAAFALDDLALLANGFHGRFYLHDVNLLYNTRRFLLGTPGDPGFGQVVGRHFHRDLVAGQDADEVGPQLAGNVSHNHMAVGLTLLLRSSTLNTVLGMASRTIPSTSMTSSLDKLIASLKGSVSSAPRHRHGSHP